MDCSPPGSSVHGILEARILEWVAISFYRGYFQHRDWTYIPCIAGRFFTTEQPGKPSEVSINIFSKKETGPKWIKPLQMCWRTQTKIWINGDMPHVPEWEYLAFITPYGVDTILIIALLGFIFLFLGFIFNLFSSYKKHWKRVIF